MAKVIKNQSSPKNPKDFAIAVNAKVRKRCVKGSQKKNENFDLNFSLTILQAIYQPLASPKQTIGDNKFSQ